MTGDDHHALTDLLAGYASIPDAKNWNGVFNVFAPRVNWDFGAIGGPTSTMSPQEILDWIKPGFTGCVATHHAITNHQIHVDADHATIRAHVRAEHWIDPNVAEDGVNCWLVVGFYDDEAIRTVDGWRLTSVRLTVTYQSGEQAIAKAIELGDRILAAQADD